MLFLFVQASLLIVAKSFTPVFVPPVYLANRSAKFHRSDDGEVGTHWYAVVRDETDLAN